MRTRSQALIEEAEHHETMARILRDRAQHEAELEASLQLIIEEATPLVARKVTT